MVDDGSSCDAIAAEPAFPVVGIGASAGGLEAVRTLFAAMPTDLGLAFVLVQHLDPTHESLLTELIGKCTSMAVIQIEDGMRVEPNRLHVIPPNATLRIVDGVLLLNAPTAPRGRRTAIDAFFRSLAADLGKQAIGVLLSGAGSDGTQGLAMIKACGGLAMAQEPSTAAYDAMPRSAIASGGVDDVLSPAEMPKRLAVYAAQLKRGAGALSDGDDEHVIDNILALIGARHDTDFGGYERGTLIQRVRRRMRLSRIAPLRAYYARLCRDAEESRVLLHDLLIGVTAFFRDPEAWQALRQQVIPELLRWRAHRQPIRVWVPGCATGEEAYGLAILLTESMEAAGQTTDLNLFATDIDSQALAIARRGCYPASSLAGLEPARLERFFEREGDQFRITKPLRDRVVVARQDLMADPPFASMDLISCRNLFIDLEPRSQERALSLFDFALRDGGYLWLGPFEGVGKQQDCFTSVSARWRIFRRSDGLRSTSRGATSAGPSTVAGLLDRRAGNSGHGTVMHNALLRHFTPAAVLIDQDKRVLRFHGAVRNYLGPSAGDPSDDLLRMVADGLEAHVRTALHQAVEQAAKTSVDGARMRRGERWHRVRIGVTPIDDAQPSNTPLLVVFEDLPEPESEPGAAAGKPADLGTVAALERELRAAREERNETLEEITRWHTDLTGSNEEVMSVNEELKSTNEELQTSKEEVEASKQALQSLNEELLTLNAQLAEKISELQGLNDDLNNLLVSSDVATLFLDPRLCLRRWTPAAGALLRLVPADVGRPLPDVERYLKDPELLADVAGVMNGAQSEPCEIESTDGQWYMRRVLPYRTHDAANRGVVLTLTQMTTLKRLNAESMARAAELRALFEAAPVGIYVGRDLACTDMDMNRAGADILRLPTGSNPSLSGSKAGGLPFRVLQHGRELAAGELPMQLAARTGETVRNFEEQVLFDDGETKHLIASAAPLCDSAGQVYGCVGIFADVSDSKRVEARHRETLERLKAHVDNSPVASVEWDADTGILRWSRAAEHMFGWREDEVLHRPLASLGLFSELEREPFAEDFGALRSGAKKDVRSVQKNRRKDGSCIWCEWYSSALCGDDGALISVLSLAMDVTQRQQLEADLRAQSERLAEADRRKNEFLSMLGHELRNPLAPVRNALDLLSLSDDDPATLAWARQVIDRQTRHLERLVHDLLDVARITRGIIALDLDRLDLNFLVHEALLVVDDQMRAFGHQVTLELPPQAVWLQGDATRLVQVLTNVLQNAAKYTDPGGTIQVSVRVERDNAVLVLDDNGQGIEPSEIPGLFDAFTQGPRSLARAEGGLGLGLTLVKKLVGLHRGDVTIHSVGPGFGCRVTLRFPLSIEPAQEEQGNPGADEPAGAALAGKKVLLVDDNEDLLDATTQVLNALGHEVLAVSTGGEALAMAQTESPDLMLLDIGLPDIDGIEVARRLSKMPQRQALRLIAVSGYGASTLGKDAALFDEHLLKPVDLTQLRRLLDSE